MSASPEFPVLHTSRLLLREITPDDAPALFAMHGDAHLMRFYGSNPLPDLASAQNLVRVFAKWRTDPNPGIRWGIQRIDPNGESDATLIGTCGLFKWNPDWRKCTVGYELLGNAQGHGYMREALEAALTWGFDQMRLNRVEAQIHPDNAASIKLVQQLNFIEEGRQREGAFFGGRYHDMLEFALLKREFGVNAAC